MLMHVKLPHDEFNDAVREGDAGKMVDKILEDAAPEAVYFTEYEGQRGAILIIDVKDPSEFPRYSEPWFLGFNADVEFHIAMTPDDLKGARLDKLGKKWA
jgi:hypothetical protein